MANYVIYGAYVLTMNDEMDVIQDGAVAVSGSRIVDIGKSQSIFKKYPNAKVLGGKNHIVLPGFVNAHNHAAMVYFRGIADDLPLKDWLDNYIWPAENKWLSPEYVSDAMELACLEMIKGGTTTFADMYFYGNSIAEVTKRIGLRAIIGETIFDFPNSVAKNADEYLEKAEEFLEEWCLDNLIKPAVAPHAPYTCCVDTYEKAKVLAEKYNVPTMTHLAESEWEISETQKKYNKSPVEHLEDIGFLDEKVLAAHCVWLSDKDIEILANRKVGAVHCIESNLKLASGIAPITKMLKAGVNVALGTDGAASNNDLSVFGEMSTIAKVHKAIEKDPTVLDAKTVLLMATREGAKAIGFDNLGYLAKDCMADIITGDFYKAHLLPIYDVYSHMVYAASASDVDNVMVNGKVLLKNKKTVSCSESDILKNALVWNAKIAKIRKKKR